MELDGYLLLHTLGSQRAAPLIGLSLTQHNSFWVGDVVRVMDDLDAVKRLQAGHGEWTDDMAPVRPPSLPAFAAPPSTLGAQPVILSLLRPWAKLGRW